MSLRAVVIGLLLVPLNAYWLVTIELVRGAQYPTSLSLFFNVIFTLVLVLAVNAPLKRFCPRLALTAPELVTVYVLVSLGSGIAGIDMMCGLVPIMGYPARYASPENAWGELVLPFLPSHLMVSDEGALEGLWTGSSSLYLPGNWTTWLPPILRWQIFVGLMCVVFLATASIFRRRWIGSERLTYPIAQIPMELTTTPERLYRAKWFWIAFAVVCCMDLVNGLHVLKPAIPQIPVRSTSHPGLNLGAQLIDRPWNAIGFFAVSFYPCIIGLGLLIPTELLLSCWVFYLVFKAEMVTFSYFGFLQAGGPPYMKEQSFGAYMGLVFFALVMSRRHLGRVLSGALRPARRAAREDGDEAWGYRVAVAAAGLGFAGLVAFGMWAGMSAWYAIAFFVIYLLISLSVTRIRAEMGPPSHEMHYVGPGQILPRLLGSRVVGRRNLISSYMFYWFNYGHRCHPMPHIAEGHQLASRVGLNPRTMALPMLAAMALGSVTACWAALHVLYQDGAAAKWAPYQPSVWIASQPLNEIVAKLQQPSGLNLSVVAAVVVGFITTVGAMIGHSRLGYWPLHPIGYAVSSAWAMDQMWFSVLIAWAIKTLVVRYGGHVAFRRAVPLAMGLVIGDFVCGSLWSLYGVKYGIRAYSIWP